MENGLDELQTEAAIADAAELDTFFKKRDVTLTAGESLEELLYMPGVIIKLFKHNPNGAKLSVLQNGIFSYKHNVLKNWVIGVKPGPSAPSSLKEANAWQSTITIDPRDIEDARWAGSSNSVFCFILTATVSDATGVNRGATKIMAMANPPENKKRTASLANRSGRSNALTHAPEHV